MNDRCVPCNHLSAPRVARLLALLGVVACGAAMAGPPTIVTVAGGSGGDGGPALKAVLNFPYGAAVAPNGDLYIADRKHHRIRKVAANGIVTTVAGNGLKAGTGFSNYPTDGDMALDASLDDPVDLAVAGNGDLYVDDADANCVYRITTAGIVHIAAGVCGRSNAGYAGDGGQATAAKLNFPTGIALDPTGNLYIADSFNYRVRKVNVAGVISTVAGNGNWGTGVAGNGAAATATAVVPGSVAIDAAGNLYIAETNNQVIRKVNAGGTITAFAGTGNLGDAPDGVAAVVGNLYFPQGLAVSADGHALYFADSGNSRLRRIDVTSGVMNIVAGTGVDAESGDGGAPTAAALAGPVDVALGGSGEFHIVDADGGRVRYVDGATIVTVAGNGTRDGDGDQAVRGVLGLPSNVLSDGHGGFFVADEAARRVRHVARDGTIDEFAGNGGQSLGTVAPGPAAQAAIGQPEGLALDGEGGVYVSTFTNVFRVDSAGSLSVAAGDGSQGYSGDNGQATAAQLFLARGVAVDAAGNLYIADAQNNRIRKVNAAGIITTFAGNGSAGFGGDGHAAINAQLNYPTGVAVDNAGNVYIADSSNARIRMVSPAGVITTVAGSGGGGGLGDGGLATSATLDEPSGVAVDAAGKIYIADTGNNRIRVVDGGIITTLAGTGVAGFAGDGGAAAAAELNRPVAVSVDPAGNVLVADKSNMRIREIEVDEIFRNGYD